MKIRIAKKIILYNPHAHINRRRWSRFEALRPPRHNRDGHLVFPSYHDIHILSRAWVRFHRWQRNSRSVNKQANRIRNAVRSKLINQIQKR